MAHYIFFLKAIVFLKCMSQGHNSSNQAAVALNSKIMLASLNESTGKWLSQHSTSDNRMLGYVYFLFNITKLKIITEIWRYLLKEADKGVTLHASWCIIKDTKLQAHT